MTSRELYARLLTYVRPYWKAFLAALACMGLTGLAEPVFPAMMKFLLDDGFSKASGEWDWMLWPLAIMALFRHYLRTFLPQLKTKRIRFHHVGLLEGLPPGVRKGIRELEEATRDHEGMVLHLAVNYGSRLELALAARRCVEDGLRPEEITEEALAARLWTAGVPDVDLLIRTSGEMRISNFLLWQCAYAEFHVTDCLWPDFGMPQLRQNTRNFVQYFLQLFRNT